MRSNHPAMSTRRRIINATLPACWRSERSRWRCTGPAMASDRHDIALSVNGAAYRHSADSRMLLSDFLRHELRLAGTHVGCEHGVCGACTILLDGVAIRSCLMLSVQANGCELSTIEGLATSSGSL